MPLQKVHIYKLVFGTVTIRQLWNRNRNNYIILVIIVMIIISICNNLLLRLPVPVLFIVWFRIGKIQRSMTCFFRHVRRLNILSLAYFSLR